MREIKPNLGLSYIRLESRICDIDKLVDGAVLVLAAALEHEDNPKGNVAMTVLEVAQDRIRELKATYYDWYRSPPAPDAEIESVPTYAKGERQ